jgi:hypothetical protein
MGMDQEIVSILVDAQAQGMGGVVRSVSLGEGLPIISSSAAWNALLFMHATINFKEIMLVLIACASLKVLII